MVPKKAQKRRNTGSLRLDKPKAARPIGMCVWEGGGWRASTIRWSEWSLSKVALRFPQYIGTTVS